jgi:hypothetical protein
MPEPAARLQIIAEFRHQLRPFLHFSETAAQNRGLQPQQHQLLLQIAGDPDKVAATIGYAAERLGLRHNTVVELSNRGRGSDRAQAGWIRPPVYSSGALTQRTEKTRRALHRPGT